MTQNDTPPDPISDDLIEVIGDSSQPQIRRQQACQKLYQRHSEWVIRQIRFKIHNSDDVQDIAQSVWMQVLQPDTLTQSYKTRNGKFRAYLRLPIRWAILKHIERLPFTLNDQGEKATPLFTEIDESQYDKQVDDWMFDEVIDNIIKPNLPKVDLSTRNVYVANEYHTIFSAAPTINELAVINGISSAEATSLCSDAEGKSPDLCSEQEISVYLPLHYLSLVDEVEMRKSTGRYLSNLLGITEAVFRKRLHTARRYLLDIVKLSIQTKLSVNHG